MKILFVTSRPGAITGSSAYQEIILDHLLPAVEGSIYRGPEDLNRQWDWIHVLDGRHLPRPIVDHPPPNLIVDLHDHYWCSPPAYPSPDRWLRRVVQKKREKHFRSTLKIARRVLVHSEAVRAAVRHDDVINVGLGVPLPSDGAAGEERNHQILLAGRDLFRKGVIPLLGAIRIVRQTIPGIELLLAGREYMHSLAFTRIISAGLPVRFLGERSREEMNRLYRKVGCVVLPSWIEAFGLVLIEGMARGAPVIATDTGGMPEVVSHRVTGQLVPPGDVDALAGAIRAVWSEPREVRDWAEAGRESVRERFSCQTMTSKIVGAYRRKGGRPAREGWND